jgi:hypothetical protein
MNGMHLQGQATMLGQELMIMAGPGQAGMFQQPMAMYGQGPMGFQGQGG